MQSSDAWKTLQSSDAQKTLHPNFLQKKEGFSFNYCCRNGNIIAPLICNSDGTYRARVSVPQIVSLLTSSNRLLHICFIYLLFLKPVWKCLIQNVVLFSYWSTRELSLSTSLSILYFSVIDFEFSFLLLPNWDIL